MNTYPANYQSYLVRLWRDGAQHAWRGSAQSTATRQIYHFADVQSLFAFLVAQLDAGEDTAATADPSRPSADVSQTDDLTENP